jgi:hypothetical protein
MARESPFDGRSLPTDPDPASGNRSFQIARDSPFDGRSLAIPTGSPSQNRDVDHLRKRIKHARERLGIPSQADVVALRNDLEEHRAPVSVDDAEPESDVSLFCEVRPQRVYAVLWPGGKDHTRTWSLDELLAFLGEEGNDWCAHESGRRHESCRKYPNGYFHITLDEDSFEGRSFTRGLEIDIPTKLSHCRVRISMDWVHYQVRWRRTTLNFFSHAVPIEGRPRTGLYCFTRPAESSVAKAFLRGDFILSPEHRDFICSLTYIVRFLISDISFKTISANA